MPSLWRPLQSALARRQGALTGVTGGLSDAGKSGYNSAKSATSSLSTGQIAAAIAAIVVGFALVCLMLWYLCIRRVKNRSKLNASEYAPPSNHSRSGMPPSSSSSTLASQRMPYGSTFAAMPSSKAAGGSRVEMSQVAPRREDVRGRWSSRDSGRLSAVPLAAAAGRGRGGHTSESTQRYDQDASYDDDAQSLMSESTMPLSNGGNGNGNGNRNRSDSRLDALNRAPPAALRPGGGANSNGARFGPSWTGQAVGGQKGRNSYRQI